MIIKIFPYKKNLEYVKFLENNFNENKNYCLIEDKTMIVNLIENNNLIGTICLLNNKDLMKFLESSNSGAAGSYIFRASKGVHIYNFTVDKKFRGKKIGSKLLKISLYIIKKQGYEYCHTHVKDDSLSSLMFSKLGFIKENVIHTETRNKKGSKSSAQELVNMTYWV